jgi:putative serine protease PepD
MTSGTAAGAANRHRAPRWLLVGLGTLVVLVAGVVGGLIVAATQSSDTNACSATNVAAETLPSVVTIMARNGAEGGSIEVLFSDGTTVPATLTGRDPQTDLAVIKVKSSESLPVIPFASSSEAQVGQPVVALGAPLGLSSTVTTGIISALDRNIEVPSDNGKNALLVAAIQTDAAINPGNSGGALTDCSGNLIGVPSAGASVPNGSGGSSSGDVGLGFAIPVSTAESVSNEIIATGHVTHSYLGLQAAQIPPAAAQQAGTSEGLYVVAVVAGSPASAAGLRRGDIITEINGETANDPNQLTAVTLTEKPGETATITYERNGQAATAKVTLGTAP